jgi:hypothetical protein
MAEKILVFKGAHVWYRSWLRQIGCIETDTGCFEILDVSPRMVEAGENAIVQVFPRGHKAIIGDELWSDGEKYIIDSGQG